MSTPFTFHYLRNALLGVVATMNLGVFAAFPSSGFMAQKALNAPKNSVSEVKTAKTANESVEPHVDLDADLFYDLFIAELLARHDHAAAASALMLDVARETRSSALYRRATDLALQERSVTALSSARAWQRAYPKSREANRYVLEILISLNRLQESKTPLERELAATPEAERGARLRELARLYASVSDRAAAANLFEAATAVYARQAATAGEAWGALGLLRARAGQMKQALDALQKTQSQAPFGEAAAVLAFTLLERGEMDLQKNPKTLAQYQQIMQQAQPIVEGYLQRELAASLRIAYARWNNRQDMPQQALDVIAPLLQPVDLTAYSRMDEVSQDEDLEQDEADTQDLEKAKENQALTIVYQAEANIVAAGLYGQLERWQELVEAIAEVERLAPYLPQRLRNQATLEEGFVLAARAELRRGNGANALIWLDKIKVNQDKFLPKFLRARAHYLQKNYDAVMAVMEAAQPQNDEEHQLKERISVQVLLDQGLREQAWQRQRQLMQRYPEDVDVAYDAAIMAEKANEFNEMERILRTIIARHPHYYHAHNALGYALAERGQSLPEARTLIEHALRHAPRDPHILDSMGWVEYRLGNHARALEILETAHATSPEGEIAAHLGEVLWVLNQRARAVEVWQKALAREPENETLKETMQRLNPQ